MFKVLLLLVTIPCLSLGSQLEIPRSSLRTCSELESIKLFHSDNLFVVEDTAGYQDVKPEHIDPFLRRLNPAQLEKFLDNGYINLKADSEGDYCLEGKLRLHGGGPVTANYFYWFGKSLYHGVAVAGFSAAIGKVSGKVGAKLGFSTTGKVAGAIVGTTLTLKAGSGAAITGSAISASGGGMVAAKTMALVAAEGSTGWATYMLGSELVGGAFAAIGLWLPTP